MASNGAHAGGRIPAVKGRSQVRNPDTGEWMQRDTHTGRFTELKRSGGSLRGVRREGGPPLLRDRLRSWARRWSHRR